MIYIKLLDLTSDVVFKSFMMSDKTNRYKARLIHLITGIPEEELIKAKYESVEIPPRNKKGKTYRTDIIVNIEKRILSIEMNKNYYDGLTEKNTTYFSALESEQFMKGENYLDYKQIIQINFDNFKKYKGNKLIYEFSMREKDTRELETDIIKSYHIDLSYLKEKVYNECNEIEKLCMIFKQEISKYEKYVREDKMMEDAYEELERISQDKNIIGLYDKEAVERKVLNTKLLYAKNQGIEETKNELALNMLKKGIPKEDVSEITGLSLIEIENLK